MEKILISDFDSSAEHMTEYFDRLRANFEEKFDIVAQHIHEDDEYIAYLKELYCECLVGFVKYLKGLTKDNKDVVKTTIPDYLIAWNKYIKNNDKMQGQISTIAVERMHLMASDVAYDYVLATPPWETIFRSSFVHQCDMMFLISHMLMIIILKEKGRLTCAYQ